MTAHVCDYDNHDDRCCMNGAHPGWGSHPDCPGRCRCGKWPQAAASDATSPTAPADNSAGSGEQTP